MIVYVELSFGPAALDGWMDGHCGQQLYVGGGYAYLNNRLLFEYKEKDLSALDVWLLE